VSACRYALTDASLTTVVLGLERVYYQLGQSDSLLPLLRTLLAGRPRDPTLRTVQLRTYLMLHRDMDAYGTFVEWANASPRESTPYREYARLLLEQNRTAAADSVLQLAARQLSSMQDLAAELAQLRSAMGLWVPSAVAWREAGSGRPLRVAARAGGVPRFHPQRAAGVAAGTGGAPAAGGPGTALERAHRSLVGAARGTA
jgi:hypothetical protein